MHIRLAKEADIFWSNQQYDKARFVHSHFANEIIAIAEIDAIKAGLGRLVKIEEGFWELGGIYVLEEYRNQKVASRIIEFLLKSPAIEACDIFCIPFTHLST